VVRQSLLVPGRPSPLSGLYIGGLQWPGYCALPACYRHVRVCGGSVGRSGLSHAVMPSRSVCFRAFRSDVLSCIMMALGVPLLSSCLSNSGLLNCTSRSVPLCTCVHAHALKQCWPNNYSWSSGTQCMVHHWVAFDVLLMCTMWIWEITACCSAAMLLLRTRKGELPTACHLEQFNTAVWDTSRHSICLGMQMQLETPKSACQMLMSACLVPPHKLLMPLRRHHPQTQQYSLSLLECSSCAWEESIHFVST